MSGPSPSHRPMRQLVYACRPCGRQPAAAAFQARKCLLSRSYYTHTAPPPSPYSHIESEILTAALARVPQAGFTRSALEQGASDAGYLPATVNLFSRGPFELIRFHLVSKRLALAHKVQFPHVQDGSKPLGVGAKIRTLLLQRLQANAPIQPHLTDALAQMSLAENIATAMSELGLLADEMWYLAGDTAVDLSWYTKRATLAGVYSTTELFMSQDSSPNFCSTEEFLDRRLSDTVRLGRMARDTSEYASFTASSTVNLLRSFGVRI